MASNWSGAGPVGSWEEMTESHSGPGRGALSSEQVVSGELGGLQEWF